MASPLGDRESHSRDSAHQLILNHFQKDLAERIDVQQMFILIDGVLPFEACLYYQVLPLFLEGSRLILGMVNPGDNSATDYVRRIISYHHYLLVPRSISSEGLQAALSAYLSYSGNKSSTTSASQAASFSHRLHRHSVRSRLEQHVDHNAQPTLVVDSPDELNWDAPLTEAHPAVAPPPVIPSNPTPPQPKLEGVPDDAEGRDQQHDIADDSTPITTIPEPAKSPAEADKPPVVPVPLIDQIPALKVKLQHLSSPPEVLLTLAPSELLQELLGRVLVGGIGRLYFERQSEYGRILWSQNGVLQSVLDRVELTLFEAVMNELKLVAQLPLVPIDKPKQIEIERIYDRTRLLLRFRFMPTNKGEEATLQVLRGAALKFYQQQKLASLERDALGIAKQLQRKLNEIRDRARAESGLAGARLEALPALSQLLRNIEEQLDSLQPDDLHTGE